MVVISQGKFTWVVMVMLRVVGVTPIEFFSSKHTESN